MWDPKQKYENNRRFPRNSAMAYIVEIKILHIKKNTNKKRFTKTQHFHFNIMSAE